MSTEEVTKIRKHHFKRFSGDSLLKKTLKKEEVKVRESEQLLLFWTQQNKNLKEQFTQEISSLEEEIDLLQK